MKKILSVVFVILVVFLAFQILRKPLSGGSLEEHTCFFSVSGIECSEELRIVLGYERFLSEQPIQLEDGGVAYYYDKPIYSKDSEATLDEIYKTSSEFYITNLDGVRNKQCSNCEIPEVQYEDFFNDESLFHYRLITVLDTKTDETFSFYVKEHKSYNVEEDNSIMQMVDVCSKNENNLCLPDQHWRCTSYDSTYKACESLIYSIKKGDFGRELCVDLEKQNLIDYCLEETK